MLLKRPHGGGEEVISEKEKAGTMGIQQNVHVMLPLTTTDPPTIRKL